MGTFGGVPDDAGITVVAYNTPGCPRNDSLIAATTLLANGKCNYLTNSHRAAGRYYSITNTSDGYAGVFNCDDAACTKCETTFANTSAYTCHPEFLFEIIPNSHVTKKKKKREREK